MRKLIGIVIGSVLGITGGYFITQTAARAIDQEAKVDCLTWSQQADVYNDFYITHSQAEQCAYYKISVNAPVR